MSALARLERFGIRMIPFSKNEDRAELFTQWMDFSNVSTTFPFWRLEGKQGGMNSSPAGEEFYQTEVEF